MKIIDWIFDNCFAMTVEAVDNMISIVNREITTEQASLFKDGTPQSNSGIAQIRDGVAIIDISGPIIPKATMFSRICGATSIDVLTKEFGAAVDNPAVKALILNIHSPGGEVTGVSEFASHIAAARDKKPVIGFTTGWAASAAYWIMSACKEAYVSDTAMVGSIGVVSAYRTGKDNGEVEIVSSQSPDKRIDASTEEGRKKIQARVDELAQVFVNTVAKNRSVSSEKVLEDFGKGGMLVGENAVKIGMVDGIDTLEGLIGKYSGRKNYSTHLNTKGGVAMDMVTLKAQHPELVKTIADEAAAAERTRIVAITGIKAPEALRSIIVSAIADPTKTEVAVRAELFDKMQDDLGKTRTEFKNAAESVTKKASKIETDAEPMAEAAEIDAMAKRIAGVA